MPANPRTHALDSGENRFRRPVQIFVCRFRKQPTSLRYSACSFELSYLQSFTSETQARQGWRGRMDPLPFGYQDQGNRLGKL